MTRRGWNLHGRDNADLRGPKHPEWKGDAANPKTKRNRAVRLYELRACDRCGKPGTDRHHRDGDTGNNTPENIAILCRHCHMEIDGRLASLAAHSAARHHPLPAKACLHCGRLAKPLRRGRCGACSEYLRRRGQERPLS